MERFDERLVVNEPSGSKFYQVVPCEDGKLVLYAEVQSTVEALQGQIVSLQQSVDVLNGAYESAVARAEALQREHDKFFDLQCPKAPPSCLMCGQVKEFSIKHLILGSVGICRDCVSLQAALRDERDRLRRAVQEAMELIHEDIVKGDKAGRRLKAEAILDRALREAALTPATKGGDGE